jgi:hypothetical protein
MTERSARPSACALQDFQHQQKQKQKPRKNSTVLRIASAAMTGDNADMEATSRMAAAAGSMHDLSGPCGASRSDA